MHTEQPWGFGINIDSANEDLESSKKKILCFLWVKDRYAYREHQQGKTYSISKRIILLFIKNTDSKLKVS